MGRILKLRAFAKVNLSLNITGRNAQSELHVLDSVMMSVDKFDTLTVAERDDGDINVRFVNAEVGADNTAYRAALAVQAALGGNGWDIEIEKGIPLGAGLGGSSADGAAVLRALDVLYGLPLRGVDMRVAALSVGSDVPFMLTGGLARVTGVGEELFFIENKLKLFIVGLMSGSVSTAKAYSEFDNIYAENKYCPSDNERLCEKLLDGDGAALEYLGNALYESAARALPEISKNAELLGSFGAAVNLTGSGGMILGYFTDIDKFATCAHALKAHDGFCVLAPVKTGILHEWIKR